MKNHSKKDNSAYKIFLEEGTKKFYEDDFIGAIEALNKAIRLGCNDRYVFLKRGCAKARLGDHKGSHIDLVQFEAHLETDYMVELLNEKIKNKAYLSDEFTNLITSSLNPQELKVIVNRFGLVDGVLRTQKEVGIFLGISSQRVSQIERKASKKIMIVRSLENLFEVK